MKIKINGKEEVIDKVNSLSDLVSGKKLTPEHIVVEHNMQIVSKDRWGKITLNENDSVEIISFVGGG